MSSDPQLITAASPGSPAPQIPAIRRLFRFSVILNLVIAFALVYVGLWPLSIIALLLGAWEARN